MALFEWMSRKSAPSPEKSHAYQLDEQTGDRLSKHLNARAITFTDGKFSLLFSRYIDAFSQRLDMVYNDPYLDPRLLASNEFNLFNDEADKAKSNLRSEFETFMLSGDELFPETSVNEETLTALQDQASKIIDKTLDDGFEWLKTTAAAMYERKIDEIEKRADTLGRPGT